MNEDQKKLMMIQNIIEANEAYHKKFLSHLTNDLTETVLINEKTILSIKKVLQGNFKI